MEYLIAYSVLIIFLHFINPAIFVFGFLAGLASSRELHLLAALIVVCAADFQIIGSNIDLNDSVFGSADSTPSRPIAMHLLLACFWTVTGYAIRAFIRNARRRRASAAGRETSSRT